MALQGLFDQMKGPTKRFEKLEGPSDPGSHQEFDPNDCMSVENGHQNTPIHASSHTPNPKALRYRPLALTTRIPTRHKHD